MAVVFSNSLPEIVWNPIGKYRALEMVVLDQGITQQFGWWIYWIVNSILYSTYGVYIYIIFTCSCDIHVYITTNNHKNSNDSKYSIWYHFIVYTMMIIYPIYPCILFDSCWIRRINWGGRPISSMQSVWPSPCEPQDCFPQWRCRRSLMFPGMCSLQEKRHGWGGSRRMVWRALLCYEHREHNRT